MESMAEPANALLTCVTDIDFAAETQFLALSVASL